MSFGSQTLKNYLARFGWDNKSWCLFDSHNQAVFQNLCHPLDYGRLEDGFSINSKYFKLTPGCGFVYSDPFHYSFSGPSLILTLNLGNIFKGSGNYFFTGHFELPKCFLKFRIPPLQIIQNWELNSSFAEAVCQQSPLPESMTQIFRDIQSLLIRQRAASSVNLILNVDSFLKQSAEYEHHQVTDNIHGETITELKLISGETLRCKIHISEKEFYVDFRGSSPSSSVQISRADAMTAIYTFFKNYFQLCDLNFPGASQLFKMIQSQDSFLSCKQSNEIGKKIALPLLAHCLDLSLQKLQLRTKRRVHSYFPIQFCLFKSDQEDYLQYYIPSAVGAIETKEASNPIDFFVCFPFLKLEELPTDLIEILSIQKKISSESREKSKTFGGHGIVLKLKVKQACFIDYVLDPLAYPSPDQQSCLLEITRGKDKISLPAFGKKELVTGDVLVFTVQPGLDL